jgi:uridine kinase
MDTDQYLCGVSILRSGASLEKGLRRVVRDVSMGSVLIQNDSHTGEPLLYDVRMPSCLKKPETARESYVFLMDSQIGTGATALMAIRVLLDHGVPQENIIVICFLISRVGGVHAICRAFP